MVVGTLQVVTSVTWSSREGGDVSWALAPAKVDPKIPIMQDLRAVYSLKPELLGW